LGGCTAHNAMILIYPHNDDWNYIAELTGDASWKAENMSNISNGWRIAATAQAIVFLHSLFGANPTRHGSTDGSAQKEAIELGAWRSRYAGLYNEIGPKAFADMGDPLTQLEWRWSPNHDPTNGGQWKKRVTAFVLHRQSPPGITFSWHRERILDAARPISGELHIETNAMASRSCLTTPIERSASNT